MLLRWRDQLGLGRRCQSLGTDQLARGSFLLKPNMKAMCASMSFLDQLMIWYSPPRGVFIINMYFMALFLFSRYAPNGRFRE